MLLTSLDTKRTLILVFDFRPERTSLNTSTEYTQLQINFLELQPCSRDNQKKVVFLVQSFLVITVCKLKSSSKSRRPIPEFSDLQVASLSKVTLSVMEVARNNSKNSNIT